MRQQRVAVCLCGHEKTAHEHYRRGTDCSLCRPGECSRFRSASGPIGRLVAIFRGPSSAARTASAPDSRAVLTLVP